MRLNLLSELQNISSVRSLWKQMYVITGLIKMIGMETKKFVLYLMLCMFCILLLMF